MAAPEPNEQEQLSEGDSAPAPAEASQTNSVEPPRRRRSLVGGFLSALIILALLAGAAGFGAISLRDKDERIALVAGYAEQAIAEARSDVEMAKAKIFELLGESAPPSAKVTTRRTAPIAQAPQSESESALSPDPVSPPADPAIVVESPRPAPLPEIKATPAADLGGVEARLSAMEEAARKALSAAEAAEAAGKSARESVEKLAQSVKRDGPAEEDGLSGKEMATALDGRIDELSNQLLALREKLDSPKNETRAAPDAEKAKVGDSAATTIVVAYALQRELEAGRPYADEIAALTRLGADPSSVELLTVFAEKGAPTAAHLREIFRLVARKLRSAEGHGGGDLTEHIIQGASKLVRVRPTGQAEPQTVDGKLDKIDAALAHGDLSGAEAAFATLADDAKTEATEFGEALRRRVGVARAADNLLHRAIAALGGAKQ